MTCRNVVANKGQSMVEYLVLCLAVAAALGWGLHAHGDVAWNWVQALHGVFARLSFALSLPT